MKIIHLSAEFAPIAKAGGMGQVLVGLSRELTRIGQQVEIILPKYDFIDTSIFSDLKIELADFKCFEKGIHHSNTVWSATLEGCKILLLETDHPERYFHRGTIYNCTDDTARFLYFSKACLEYIKNKNEPIDILHLHDWHVAIAAVLAKDFFNLPIKATLLTLHNTEYQGLCATWDLDAIGLNGSDYLIPQKLQHDPINHPETLNLLKGGIVYADAINTVSPTYAKEILTPTQGHGLDALFRQYKYKLNGILNGIDQKLWDPETDPSIPIHYSEKSALSTICLAKNAAKELLQKKFHLTPNMRPWIGAVTRIVPQKGPELLEEGISLTIQSQGIFLLLGSSPIPSLQKYFETLKHTYEQPPYALLHFEYDDVLAHLIYAALDFVLVPSHFEPCGLTQLIAMRYGTIPIVRATGGLKDTVFDCEDSSVALQKRNGFLFQNATPLDCKSALNRAIHLFRSEPSIFQSMIQRVMRIDNSWEKPAQKYLRLYTQMISKIGF